MQQGLAVERFLFALTDDTGGQVLNGDASGGLAAVFEKSLAHFRTRYEITYTRAAPPTRGWHAIDIDLPGRRGVTVRARRGYRR